MTEAIDTQHALQAVERLQAKLKARGHGPMEEKLSLLKALLLSPLFHQILTLQSTSAHEESHSQKAALAASSSCPELNPETRDSQVRSAASSDSGPRDSSPAAAGDASMPPSPTQSSSDPVGAPPKPLLLHMAQGCYVTEELPRSPPGGPGFAGVSLRREETGNPGVFAQDVQPGSAESRKLREGDILATNGQLMDQTVTKEVGLLQEHMGDVLLKVTRGPVPHLGSLAASRKGSGHHGVEGTLEKSASEQAEMTGPVKVKAIFPRGASDQVHDGEQLDTLDVELIKNTEGLGITVGSYVTEESAESVGVFVKSVTKESEGEQDGQIHVGDQLVAVDGTSIQGYGNQQVTALLRATSQTVVLKLLKRSLRLEDGPAAPAALEPGPSTEVENGNQPSVHDADLGGALGLPVTEETLCHSQTVPSGSNLAEEQADYQGATLTMPAEDGNLESVLEHRAILGQEEAHSGSSWKSISVHPEGRRRCGASVMPEGPVRLTGEPCAEEKLLEVSGVPLFGESIAEGRSFPKGLPASVSMVTSSPARSELSDSSADQRLAEEPSPYEEPGKEGSEGDKDMVPDVDNITGGEVPVETPDSPLAMWEAEIQYIDLERGDAGLGFSILDYQDPADLAKTVIVIRSLVPDGVADLDGRLYPGDRLVSVNGADLADAGLEEAVRALKGAPAGAVRLGITKAIFMDSNEADLMNEKTFDPHYSKEEGSFQAATLAEPGSTWRAGLDCQMLMRTSAPEEEGQHTETADMGAGDKRDVTAASDFQRTITVVRGNSSLGMTVSALKDGSGVVIRSIVHGGSVSRDGRLGVGDCIVAINEEPTRSRSNAEGRALLRKHSLIGPEISLTYVPAEFLETYRAGLPQRQAADATDDASPLTCEHVLQISEQEEGGGENGHQSDTAQLDWNQLRTVKLCREAGKSLGISIVGGRGMGRRLSNGGVMRGIFIKHVLEDSPAGRSGTLKDGDMILEVGGRDLRSASHKEAVEAIRRAGDPVVFLVQSVAQGAPPPLPFLQSNPCPGPDPPSPCRTPAPPEKKYLCNLLKCFKQPPAVDVSEEEEVDGLNPSYNRTESSIQCRTFSRLPPAKTFTPAPFKLSAHRDMVKTPLPAYPPLELPQMPHVGETDTDMVQDVPERPPLPFSSVGKEDGFGYSWGTLDRRYGGLLEALHMVELELGTTGLGLTLAASRGCSATGVFVESVDPRGAAGKDGHILVGDELLEINGQILYGCSHKDASTVIESAPSRVNIIFIRNIDAFDQMAVGAVKKCRDVLGAEPEDPGGLVTDAGEASGLLIGSLTGEERVTAGNLPGNVAGLLQPGVSVNDPDLLPSAAEPGRRVSGGLKALVSLAPDRGSGRPLAPSSDLWSRPIIPGCETTTGVPTGHADLSLGILGGSDIPSEVIVFQELSEEGAATKDGHLHPGDQILEVNSIEPRAGTREEGLGVVSRTPRRDKAGCGEPDLWDVFTLELAGEPGQELGLKVLGKRNDPGVFISEILQGGTTEADSRLKEGDRILSVNGEDVRAASQQYVTALLKCCSRPISLQVARCKVRNIPTEGSQSLCSQPGCFREDTESPGTGTAGGTVGPLGDVPVLVHPAVPGAESPALKVAPQRSSPEPAVAGLPDSGGALQNDLRPPQHKTVMKDYDYARLASEYSAVSPLM
ncbi:multiple PDZ domain protein-like isoform X3 [Brienomyrus brachyistius]|uniref:multiple PDZ domain protein-like isoform X3 n=1 Tax=Brienomyrus brachyistius TaxID=42636 RepID=UPI0020B382CD|nr:multiple PDZ domain protein-like isoform X3 [Brienomyrus brachyistius]